MYNAAGRSKTQQLLLHRENALLPQVLLFGEDVEEMQVERKKNCDTRCLRDYNTGSESNKTMSGLCGRIIMKIMMVIIIIRVMMTITAAPPHSRYLKQRVGRCEQKTLQTK